MVVIIGIDGIGGIFPPGDIRDDAWWMLGLLADRIRCWDICSLELFWYVELWKAVY